MGTKNGHREPLVSMESSLHGDSIVTSQDFIKFWGNFFAFVLLVLIDFSQGFKTFEFI
jgi:hypothetical protein